MFFEVNAFLWIEKYCLAPYGFATIRVLKNVKSQYEDYCACVRIRSVKIQ